MLPFPESKFPPYPLPSSFPLPNPLSFLNKLVSCWRISSAYIILFSPLGISGAIFTAFTWCLAVYTIKHLNDVSFIRLFSHTQILCVLFLCLPRSPTHNMWVFEDGPSSPDRESYSLSRAIFEYYQLFVQKMYYLTLFVFYFLFTSDSPGSASLFCSFMSTRVNSSRQKYVTIG